MPSPRKLRRAWEIFYYQMGGELFDPNFSKATFNNEKGLKALEFLVNIFNAYGWNVVGGNGYAQFTAWPTGYAFCRQLVLSHGKAKRGQFRVRFGS